jgi:hypothetical protein
MGPVEKKMGNLVSKVPQLQKLNSELRLVAGAASTSEGSSSSASIFVSLHILLLTAGLRVSVGCLGAQEVIGVLAGAALLARRERHHESGRSQNNKNLFHRSKGYWGVWGANIVFSENSIVGAQLKFTVFTVAHVLP